MGYITIESNVDVDVEISMHDIIQNLYRFKEKDIEDLKKEIGNLGKTNENAIITENLLDVQKLEILKELFEKLNLNDLEDIKNKYINKK
ncbi:MAG: hypothetical protein ACOC3V_01920 [bacterium]